MASQKPLAHPPDMSNVRQVQHSMTVHGPGIVTGAENANEIPQDEENRSIISTALHIHPVLFTVNDDNVARFLSEVMEHIQLVDKKAGIISKPEGELGDFTLRHMSQKPEGLTNKQFVDNFVFGLKATATQMKGKIWIQTMCKFATIKKDHRVQKWLLERRVRLERTLLPGTARHSVGLFVNTVTRYDCLPNFAACYAEQIQAASHPYSTPDFEIDIQYLFRKSEGNQSVKTRAYRMVAASKSDSLDLMELMGVIHPRPLESETSFVPSTVWSLLPSENKDGYFNMQYNFSEKYDALQLRGIKDLSIQITETRQVASNSISRTMTIYEWVANFKASSGQNLFYKVIPCRNGDVEIWYDQKDRQEAQAWVRTALSQLARSSRIDPEADPVRFELMFKDPEKV
jgi:hypothetical protein